MSRAKAKGYGIWTFEIIGLDGKVRWRERRRNMTVNSGLSLAIRNLFAGSAQSTNWYVGLISSSSFTGVAATDTIASHAGWTEFTGYAESTRQLWNKDTEASQAITSLTATTTVINANGTLKGAFIVNENTKGGATGTLFATGLFSSARTVVAGEVARFTYTFTMSGA